MQKTKFHGKIIYILVTNIILFPSLLFALDYAKEQNQLNNQSFYSAGEFRQASVWLQPFGETGRQDDYRDLQGYQCNLYGLSVGIEDETTDRINLGLALGYARSVIKLLDEDHRTTLYTYQAKLNSIIKMTPSIFTDLSFGLGSNSYYRHRNYHASDGSFKHTDEDFHGNFVILNATLGDKLRCNNVYFTPLASVNYVYLREDGYTVIENGISTTLMLPTNATVVTLGIGFELESAYKLKPFAIIPQLHVFGYYDAQEGHVNISTSLVTGGPIISTNADPGRLLGVIGFNLHVDICRDLQLLFDYDFQARAKFYNNVFYLNLRYIL